jgi:hypothetical protein
MRSCTEAAGEPPGMRAGRACGLAGGADAPGFAGEVDADVMQASNLKRVA